MSNIQDFAIGKKVVGRWGAALPESYGKIVGTGKLGVRVRWDDLGETFYQYGELRNDYYDPQGSPVGVYVWVN